MTKEKKINLFSNFVSKNVRVSICFTVAIVVLLGIALCYYFMPLLLNYGPGTINTEFDKEFSSGLTYFTQYALIYLVLMCLIIPFIFWYTKDFKNIDKLKERARTEEKAKKRIEKIVLRCMVIPQYLFIIISFVPAVLLSIVFFFLHFTSFADVKVILVTFTISLLGASLAYIFLKSTLKSVLTSIGNTVKYEKAKLSLTATLILQLSATLLVCVLYTFLLSYSNNMNDKSKVLAKHYQYEITSIMETKNIRNLEELQNELSQMQFISDKDGVFLIDENGSFINFTNAEVSEFFEKYATDLAKQNDNLVYDYYGTDAQGVIIPHRIDGKDIQIVIRYDLSNAFLGSIFSNLIIIMIYCVLSVYFFSSFITKEITLVTDSMNNISKTTSSNGIREKLAVTSNDEMGDLVVAFNDIQDLTSEYIHQIENNQQVLLEQERLASLGQMIGGIAHNLKTPIMSISGAAEGLTELTGEYLASISNPQVTAEDHREIAKDMLDWITKIKTHTSYMSDIITAVKGQASQLATSEYSEFTVYDLSKKVDILVKHEIKKALLTLETTIDCDPTLKMHGDVNNLIQVIINLISNSIQSYEGKPNEKIYFNINADAKTIFITVKDTGCGMTNETKEKLFKEMFTTKGKNGTGLGLYMSYSTIKGKFNGTINFESEVGKGTTFVIEIPRGGNQ